MPSSHLSKKILTILAPTTRQQTPHSERAANKIPSLFSTQRHLRLRLYLSGANDASRPEGHKTHYGVSLAEYKRNLRWIAGQYAAGAEGPVIVICTPPPVDEPRRLHLTTDVKGMPPELLDRTAARTEMYANAAAEVAAELGVAMADLHGGTQVGK